jgi:acid phosphatase type 7
MKTFAILLLLAAITLPSPAALTRGPYLQNSTPSSIVLRWRTSAAETSRVIYGTNFAALNLTNTDAANVTEHIATLTNLSADTKYFYTLGTTNTLLAGNTVNHFFLTHPPSGTPKPLRVWVIGDAGTATANQVNVRNAFETYNGTNTLHAWLQLGDNAYNTGTDAEYQAAVFTMYTNELRNSVTWSTLGNHETAQATTFVDTYPYFSIFTLPTAGEAGGVASGTEHWYSFDFGMVHFICLDSMTASRATNGAMATWLRSDLAVTTNRWLIAMWHHPPYSKGSHDSDVGGPSYDTQMGEMRTNFLPILENGGVDLVFSGHSHIYERSKLLNSHYGLSGTFSAANHVIQTGSGRETNGLGAYRKPDGLGERPIGNRGTIYTVAGSSGQATTGTANHPAMYYSALSLGSVVLDFNSNRLDAVFLRETGATNDSFTIIKDGTHPPQLNNSLLQTNGDFQFTVLTRGWRTNFIQASGDLAPNAWQTIGTNYTTNTSFSFTHTNALTNGQQFYRVRR